MKKILLRIIILMSLGSIFFGLSMHYTYAYNKHAHLQIMKPTRDEQRAYQMAWHRQWHPHTWHYRGQHWWHYEGWRYGYWWGWGPYHWEGKIWGLGYSRYPWYWCADDLAMSLTLHGQHLYQLAEQKKWDEATTLVEQRIKEYETELESYKHKSADSKTIKRVQRKIDRLERYLEDIEQYRHYH